LNKQQSGNINSLKSQKIKTSNYLRLISYKRGKEKEQFEFKDQQNVKDFIERQKKQDEMMKEFAKKMKDNLIS
jgi:hypothetical protein